MLIQRKYKFSCGFLTVSALTIFNRHLVEVEKPEFNAAFSFAGKWYSWRSDMKLAHRCIYIGGLNTEILPCWLMLLSLVPSVAHVFHSP